jgi:transcriptional regulator with XRE-family HTH domain
MRRTTGGELRRMREDAGLSKAAVAGAAGIDPTYLGYIEAGEREARLEVLCRVSAALGSDVSLRIYPNTGPPLRDRTQVRMVDAFLAMLPATWERHLEVPVYRPVRGVIDLVIAHRPTGRIVTVEAQSDLRRLEQQLRWAAEKTDALPSAAVWPALSSGDRVPALSRILLLRSTRATRELAQTHAATFSAAYPADPRLIMKSLLEPELGAPGSGILWVRVEGRAASIVHGTPRGAHARS